LEAYRRLSFTLSRYLKIRNSNVTLYGIFVLLPDVPSNIREHAGDKNYLRLKRGNSLLFEAFTVRRFKRGSGALAREPIKIRDRTHHPRGFDMTSAHDAL
jgi:hypothetical protein